MVKSLSTLSTSDRLKIALGGFVSFTGFIVLLIVVLTSTGAVDMNSVFQNQVMVAAVAFLGVVDVLCGVLLVFREKRLKWLIAPKKKEANNNVQKPDKTPQQ